MRATLTMGHGDRGQLRCVTDWETPVPASDEVLLRIAATAVNYHDIMTRRGMPGIKIGLPIITGSDIAGEIVALGSGVNDWSIGDRVLVDPVLRGGDRFGMIGETRHGGRAEFVAAPARQLIAVPDGVDLEAAASLPLAYGTAYRMLITQGGLAAGERVLVLGASGGVGAACVQLAKLFGAEVVACASSRSKVDRLAEIGADHCINYSERNFAEAVRELYGKPRVTGGGGVDVAVNFTGGDTWVDTQRCVRLGGRILTCGATAGFDVKTDMRFLWTFEHRFIGSNGWSPADLEALLDLIDQGRLRPVIDKILPLEDAGEAERMLEDREVFGKVLLKP
ncbi:zinc-binding dehydrogenase [Phenylobacterium sp. LH3H17]|uniref:zinc-binding dehydrogenase n=1 Tax=Phenylobacterium sp. LH3H17 TaxID=2903901 RepID=UPI0020C953FA|nr:zinc-binding dehydrogenase [Phenylobacterium sp. LH3H17]UTP38275.1 zinc-binding dehydrogenase [Phenylobacterium sp. LH3H17]